MHAPHIGAAYFIDRIHPCSSAGLGSHCCVTREREGARWGARCRGWGVWGQQETRYAIFLNLWIWIYKYLQTVRFNYMQTFVVLLTCKMFILLQRVAQGQSPCIKWGHAGTGAADADIVVSLLPRVCISGFPASRKMCPQRLHLILCIFLQLPIQLLQQWN